MSRYTVRPEFIDRLREAGASERLIDAAKRASFNSLPDLIAQARAEERAAATYIDPNGEEVLAHRDERHIVLPAEEVRRLRAAEERLAALKEGTEPVADAEPGGIAVDPTPVGDEEPAPAADVPSYPYTQERYIERERVSRVIAEVRALKAWVDLPPWLVAVWRDACDAIEAGLGGRDA